jgi:hypothetical protein
MISNVVIERNYKDEIYPRKAGGKFGEQDWPVAMDGHVPAMLSAAREPEFQMMVVEEGDK